MVLELTADWDDFAKGPYRAVNNVWNKGSLANGPDFTQTISLRPGSFPDGVSMEWSWPGFKPAIYAYPEVILGYKPWHPGEGSLAFSSRVDALRSFEARFDIRIDGETDKFNVALEFWLTDRKGGGPGSINTEVMLWLHNGSLTPAGDKRGSFRTGDYRAAIYVEDEMRDGSGESPVTWRYVALKAKTHHLAGAIELREVLVALRKEGLITGREWIGGFELGAEIAGGNGRMSIDALGHDFAKHAVSARGDRLAGTGGPDLIGGRGGDDRIDGRGGDDELRGGVGRDRLNGGEGSDRLAGGSGADRYVFAAKPDGGNVDRLVGFEPAEDLILLDDAVFPGLPAGGLPARLFNSAGAAETAAQRILYDPGSGLLRYDRDGAGDVDGVVFAKLARGLALDAGDFVVI